MERTLISGYISLKSILEAKSREVYEVVLDKDRYDKVQASNFHVNEKRQYERIQHSGVSIRFVSEEEFNNLGVGTTSGGKPTNPATGAARRQITSTAPLLRSRLTANTSPRIVGAI